MVPPAVRVSAGETYGRNPMRLERSRYAPAAGAVRRNSPALFVIVRAFSTPRSSTRVRNAPASGALVMLSVNCPRTLWAGSAAGTANAAMMRTGAMRMLRPFFPPPESLRLELREPVQVSRESPHEESHHTGQQDGQGPVGDEADRERAFDVPQRCKRERGVQHHEQQADFGRPDATVGDLEDAEHSRLEIHVDRECEIHDHESERQAEVHVWRQPDPETDDGGRERVHDVIDIVAVLGALGAAHARERAVEAVADPVHTEHQARHPEPGGVVRRERVGGPGTHRAERAEHRQVVGSEHARHALGEEPQHPPLDAGQQKRHLARCVRHAYQPSVFTTASTDSKGLSSIAVASAGSVMVCSVSGPLTSRRTTASPSANLIRSGTNIANPSGTSVCLTRRCAVYFPPSAGSTFHAKV